MVRRRSWFGELKLVSGLELAKGDGSWLGGWEGLADLRATKSVLGGALVETAESRSSVALLGDMTDSGGLLRREIP